MRSIGFVALGEDGMAYKSEQGDVWTGSDTGNTTGGVLGMSFNGDVFVIVASTGKWR